MNKILLTFIVVLLSLGFFYLADYILYCIFNVKFNPNFIAEYLGIAITVVVIEASIYLYEKKERNRKARISTFELAILVDELIGFVRYLHKLGKTGVSSGKGNVANTGMPYCDEIKNILHNASNRKDTESIKATCQLSKTGAKLRRDCKNYHDHHSFYLTDKTRKILLNISRSGFLIFNEEELYAIDNERNDYTLAHTWAIYYPSSEFLEDLILLTEELLDMEKLTGLPIHEDIEHIFEYNYDRRPVKVGI